MASEIDFNRVLEQIINRPIESTVDVSAGFSAAGPEIGVWFFFLMLLLMILMVVGLVLGFFYFTFIKK